MTPIQQLHAFFEATAPPDLMATVLGKPAIHIPDLVKAIGERGGTRADVVKYRRRLRGSPVTFEQVKEYARRWNEAGYPLVSVRSVVEAGR